MSEKLDGMRCFWAGENIFTQNGNVISAPVAIVRSLPPTALDGELASSVVVGLTVLLSIEITETSQGKSSHDPSTRHVPA